VNSPDIQAFPAVTIDALKVPAMKFSCVAMVRTTLVLANDGLAAP
jgi:hypothetical protein